MFGVSQKTVSNVVMRVVQALNHPMILDRFVQFRPESSRWCTRREEEFAHQSAFSCKWFWGSLIFILLMYTKPASHSRHAWCDRRLSRQDSTTTRARSSILLPQHVPQYYCRKAFPAVNMVAVVDARGRFLYANSSYPGSCHDSSIWARTAAMHVFNNGSAVPGYRLLGDSGFADSIAIMTP